MPLTPRAFAAGVLCFLVVLNAVAAVDEEGLAHVRVSPRDPRYFELSDGRPYIPIGLNMVRPPTDSLDGMEAWFAKLSAQGGNFVRIWLSSPFFDVEHAQSGVFDEDRAKRIDALLALARKYGIRLKLCTEHFRHLGEGTQGWAAKPQHLIEHGGPAKNTADFFRGEAGRAQYKRKLAWYAARYDCDPIIFGWELWNEMDAVMANVWELWTAEMLPELHRLFPHNLAMQSLGSYDHENKRDRYRRLCQLQGNDVLQVHRYLDLGAAWEVCHGPVAILAAEAVKELRAFGIQKPILLAESGAVEPRHTGPFKLYEKDKEGIILHDVLFAPFFVGAAGPGHIWHWDVYVDRNNLWWHFGRFAEVVRDLDPPAEHFEPVEIAHPRLLVYALKGVRTTLIWCRDKENTWRTELAEDIPPASIEGATLEPPPTLSVPTAKAVRFYDPWQNTWQNGDVKTPFQLPTFQRSLVIRIDYATR